MKFLANRATSFPSLHRIVIPAALRLILAQPLECRWRRWASLENVFLCFAIQALPGREGRIEPPLVRGIPIQRSWGQPENQAR